VRDDAEEVVARRNRFVRASALEEEPFVGGFSLKAKQVAERTPVLLALRAKSLVRREALAGKAAVVYSPLGLDLAP
jgi:hypothetical protein